MPKKQPEIAHEHLQLLANYGVVNAKNIASMAFVRKNLYNGSFVEKMKNKHNNVQRKHSQLSEYVGVLNSIHNKNNNLKTKYANMTQLLDRYHKYEINQTQFITNVSRYNMDLDTLYKSDLNGIIANMKRYVRLYAIQQSSNVNNNPNYYNKNDRQIGETIHLAGKAAIQVLPIAQKLKVNYNRNGYKKMKKYYASFVDKIYSRQYPNGYNNHN
jgi:hypothetical protein